MDLTANFHLRLCWRTTKRSTCAPSLIHPSAYQYLTRHHAMQNPINPHTRDTSNVHTRTLLRMRLSELLQHAQHAAIAIRKIVLIRVTLQRVSAGA